MMKKKRLCSVIIAIILIALPLISCEASPSPRIFTRPDVSISANNITDAFSVSRPDTILVEEKFVLNTADFSVELFQNVFSQNVNSNSLVSPLSVLFALGMTANGAGGETLEQMERVLAGGISIERLNNNLFSYREELISEHNSILETANSIWFRDYGGINIDNSFLETNKRYFDACAFRAPFNSQTVSDINNWVYYNTFGMINRVVNYIPPDAIMYLINTIAFYSEWETRFGNIHDAAFTDINGAAQTISFMEGRGNRAIRGDDFVGFKKPYYNHHYSFMAIMPDSHVDFSDFVDSLTGEKFMSILDKANALSIDVVMPKFEFNSSISLSGAIKDMGIVDAFDIDTADFNRIGTAPLPIHIGDVLHSTFISVDEIGTRAAAATTVIMFGCSAEPPPEQIILNRPFMFSIIDNSSNLPLFIGAFLTD